MPQRRPGQQPPAGAPAAGAGGQKAGGTAAPPKAARKPPPPAGALAAGAGGQKGAAPGGQQAVTKKPGQAPRPLNLQQQTQMKKAAQQGNLDQYLANHPGVQSHMSRVQANPSAYPGMSTQAANLQSQNTTAKNAQAQPPPPQANAPVGTTPPQGAPQVGAGGQKGAAQPTPAPTPAAEPTFSDAFNKQYGAGAANQFGNMSWYGGNPIETAGAAAQRKLDENLANVRARYAGSGFGSSGREALSEGQAMGDFATGFGDVAAQRGVEARAGDLDRLAQMFATSGQQDIASKQLGLEANQQLMQAGTGLTGIGAGEQQIPNMADAITMLTNMAKQPGFSRGAQKQPSK